MINKVAWFKRFEGRAWQQVALVLNVVGAFLLFISFQPKESDIRIVTTVSNEKEICVDGQLLTSVGPGTRTMLSSGLVCPDWEKARPAAVVDFESPSLTQLAFILLFLGFVLQLVGLPDPNGVQGEIDALRAHLETEIKFRKFFQ